MKLEKAGRPIGVKVRRVANILDEMGPMTLLELVPLMPEEGTRAGVHKYLKRAVTYGLLTLDGWHFAVVPGWRGRIDVRAEVFTAWKPRKGPLPVTSVWDLAR